MTGKTLDMYFTKGDLEAIAEQVTKQEETTCAEIGVHVAENCDEAPREYAERKFLQAGLDKTEERTGVLITLVLDRRAIEIVADDGIDEKVSQQTWDAIVQDLSADFREGRYLEGLTRAITNVGSVCKDHFPIKDGDRNELSNEVIE